MKQPPFLQIGDTVAILSTARKIEKNELIFAKKFLESEGYKVVFGKSVGLKHYQFAGTDIERANDFQEALRNPKIKAIWCARGGYGTVRIIDNIDFKTFIKQPKWIIGYSDITVLHSKIQHLGFQSMHAPMAFDLEKCTKSVQNNFKKILKGTYSRLQFSSSHYNRLGNVKAKVIGGNLSVLYSLCGSKDVVETKGKILFLEDLDEYLYHIDRMLQNLKRNGYLKDLAALVIGGMTHMHDNKISFGYAVEEIVLEITNEYNYPVFFDAPFGHVEENQPIIFGQFYELRTTNHQIIIQANKL